MIAHTAGFQAVTLDKWDGQPWQVVENIEFRSVTVTAVKGENKDCVDMGHAVIYRGPFAEITDDEGHVYPRGERIAVCERTFRMLNAEPYAKAFIGIVPAALHEAKPWCAPPGTRRPASESKGAAHNGTHTRTQCC